MIRMMMIVVVDLQEQNDFEKSPRMMTLVVEKEHHKNSLQGKQMHLKQEVNWNPS